MKAFVTGGTGLLGNNLVRVLVTEGHSVKVLVRSAEKAQKLLGDLNVEIVTGDMEDVSGFAEEMAGCDVMFHTAAYFREYFGVGDHWRKLEKINVHGTIDVLNAAEEQGVGKVIYVSSSGVIGKTETGHPSDESTPADKHTMQNLYFHSKVVAEARVAEWLKEHDLPVVQILPSAIFGPGDAAPTSAGQLILDFLHDKMPAIPPGGFSIIDVRDVAKAMVTAVEKGRSGERYIISNRYASMSEIFSILAKVSGKAKPRLHMPVPVAMTYAYLSEGWARLTGSDPLVTVNAIRTLTANRNVAAHKAMRELDFMPRSLEDTFRDEVRWYLENGYVQANLLKRIVVSG